MNPPGKTFLALHFWRPFPRSSWNGQTAETGKKTIITKNFSGNHKEFCRRSPLTWESSQGLPSPSADEFESDIWKPKASVSVTVR